jgi:thiamine-phosphate pyrophosphorylase
VKRLPRPPYICLITEGKADPENYDSERSRIVRTAAAAVADGVNMIQVREKALPAGLVFDLTRAVVDALAGSDALVIVNDRADIASTAGAGGVHLPETSLSPAVVRGAFGNDLVIGVSTHSFGAAKAAAEGHADYSFFGPLFDTPGKGEPVGVAVLEEVCRGLEGFPVIALGGIDAGNFATALNAGAAGIAAIRALNDAASRRQILTALRSL